MLYDDLSLSLSLSLSMCVCERELRALLLCVVPLTQQPEPEPEVVSAERKLEMALEMVEVGKQMQEDATCVEELETALSIFKQALADFGGKRPKLAVRIVKLQQVIKQGPKHPDWPCPPPATVVDESVFEDDSDDDDAESVSKPEGASDKVYVCMNGCGFEGSYVACEEHEATCMTPAAANIDESLFEDSDSDDD